MLAAVFQHDWAEGLLDFTRTGTVTDWVPLFAFVILFGLSMDYTILVLERIREARRDGHSRRARRRRRASARPRGAVTSAALVMVAVFAIFATMPFLEHEAARRRPRGRASCSTRRSCAASRCRPRSRCSASAAGGWTRARPPVAAGMMPGPAPPRPGGR